LLDSVRRAASRRGGTLSLRRVFLLRRRSQKIEAGTRPARLLHDRCPTRDSGRFARWSW